MAHRTVLLQETIEYLNLSPGLRVFEGTGGSGGLSVEIARRIRPKGKLIVTDLDAAALARLRAKLEYAKLEAELVQDNFRNISKIVTGKLDRIVLDLGFSSEQVEESNRGFSFNRDEPLVMTFKSNPAIGELAASEIVNNWKEESLADIFWGWGGERRARQIARAIVDMRPIETSKQLANVIAGIVSRHGKLHPATRVFQAIRMVVNDELGALRQVLADGWRLLASQGRVVVISFHELEDKEVKKFFSDKELAAEGEVFTGKPLVAQRREILENPRSRSARLRCITKK